MSERVLLFQYAGETLALPAPLCREAFVPPHLLPLPGAHTALLGLTQVRGRAVPVLHLSALLGLGAAPALADTPALALLTELAGEPLAVPVQQVTGVALADRLPAVPELLSDPFPAGDHSARLLNLTHLIHAARARLALA